MDEKIDLMNTRGLLIAWRENKNKNALTQLVVKKRGLVLSTVKEYLNKGLSLDELKSAGYEGMIKAINTFNYEEEAIENLDQYLILFIESSITNEIIEYNKHSHDISIERQVGENIYDDEMTVEERLEYLEAEELFEEIISEISNENLRNALQNLTPIERKIVFLRYGLDDSHSKTQEDLAKLLCCSKQDVQETEAKALKKMRQPKNIIKSSI